MILLQSVVFPNREVAAPEDTYVRMDEKVRCDQDNSVLLFREGGVASSDTYYGALSVTTWHRHTGLQSVVLQLEGEGRFTVSLELHRHHHLPKVSLTERTLELRAGEPAELPVPNWSALSDGLLFFRVEALSAGKLTAARYVTAQPRRNEVRLGLVITHFNRIAQVLPAIERIRRLLRRPDVRGRVTLTVVDNSRNLPLASDGEITVIPNRNLGGTGGFVRGLLSLVDGGRHTHALFMDDDASCEAESIARTLALLSYAVTPRLAVAGALISERLPWQLQENGALFDGTCVAIGEERDLRTVDSLMRCDFGDPKPHYGGWWFFAFALADVRRWPFPFFVRGDDIFFSLTNDFEIATVMGVACYGEEFHVKHGPLTAYLDARYHLLHAVLRERGATGAVLKLVRRLFIKSLAGYHYASARAVTLALRHIALGPQFFRDNMDLARVRAEISGWTPSEKLGPVDVQGLQLSMPCESGREAPLRRFARTLTLQGVLLPRALLREQVLVHEKTFHGRASDVWRFRRVLYRHAATDTGFIAEFDRSRHVAELRGMWRALRELLRQQPRLRQAYGQALVQMGSSNFWRGVYGLPEREGDAMATSAACTRESRVAQAETA